MAAAGQDKSAEHQDEAKEGNGQGRPAAETVTITLPSMANLPPLPPVQLEPKRLLWLGGLAALGVIGIVEWPIVAAIGVGSYVAERFARDEIRKSSPERR